VTGGSCLLDFDARTYLEFYRMFAPAEDLDPGRRHARLVAVLPRWLPAWCTGPVWAIVLICVIGSLAVSPASLPSAAMVVEDGDAEPIEKEGVDGKEEIAVSRAHARTSVHRPPTRSGPARFARSHHVTSFARTPQHAGPAVAASPPLLI
jgi:hypothetical protein